MISWREKYNVHILESTHGLIRVVVDWDPVVGSMPGASYRIFVNGVRLKKNTSNLKDAKQVGSAIRHEFTNLNNERDPEDPRKESGLKGESRCSHSTKTRFYPAGAKPRTVPTWL